MGTPLPTKDGVGPSCVALPPGRWMTIFEFLIDRFPNVGHHEWSTRIQQGEVVDTHGTPVHLNSPYQAHNKLYYYRCYPTETSIPFHEVILFQDDHLVVVDKPHFLPVIPSGRYVQETLLVRLKRKLGIDSLTPIHRIDRETGGLVLFTIQPQTRDSYQNLFRQRTVTKTYEAIAPWRSELQLPMEYQSRLMEGSPFMQMREIDGEPNAHTSIEVLEVHGTLARYRLRPITGQKHQLRAHMAALGIPIVNDQIYPTLFPDSSHPPDYHKPLQLLAKSIEFIDPSSGTLRQFESQQRLQEIDLLTASSF